MALLTAAEKAELAKEGLWVREKCDGCNKPILSPVTFVKKDGRVFCASCVKGQDLVLANTKEENEMAKVKAEKKAAPKKETTTIAGHLREGTAIADLYLFLEDEKKHSLKDAKKVLSKHKADPMGRIYQLGRYGKKGPEYWAVIVDEETIQLKKGKAAASAPKEKKAPPAKAKEAPAKKATSKKEQEPDETAAMPSKALKATMALVRRTLKSGKDWTKNKLIENLIEEHDQDPKRVTAAIQEEIKAGGIKIEDGILELV
jgi:uncharacterized Zn finger protein (UPF0148 family)